MSWVATSLTADVATHVFVRVTIADPAYTEARMHSVSTRGTADTVRTLI
jgi:hypothetical protein